MRGKFVPQPNGRAEEFDYAVTLGCKDTCPFVPADKHIEWRVPDPKGKDMDFFRKVRDEIKSDVERLLKKEDIL